MAVNIPDGINHVTHDTLDLLLPVLTSYQACYNRKDVTAEENRAYIGQFIDQPDRGAFHIYAHKGEALGFTGIYFNYSTVRTQQFGLMNDLFVAEKARRHGIGRALVSNAAYFCLEQGCKVMRWATEMDNTTAQSLYSKMAHFKTDWKHYEVLLEHIPKR